MSTPLHVLIVEDSSVECALLILALKHGGFEPVYERVDVPETMKAALKRQEWDIVLSGSVLSCFRGPEALNIVKERGVDIPFIVVTGQIGEPTAIEMLSAGANDYVRKGNLARLAPAVQRALKDAGLRRERREAEEALRKAYDELRNANAKLERQAIELKAANKELEAFTFSVSHDLRAPLRQIDGFSKSLLQDYADKLDERGKRYLEFLCRAGATMAQMIDDLLSLSRVSSSEMHRTSVALSEMAQSVAKGLWGERPDRRVEFVIAPNVIVNGDARLLRIVIENLLDNAWKFTSQRPVSTIEFGSMCRDDEPVYFVRDNGVGFNPSYAGNLFTPFQRLHSVDEFSGSGIGLATAQRIIHRHGGRVWAEGAVEQGETFFFTL